jgi:hypothetical protein
MQIEQVCHLNKSINTDSSPLGRASPLSEKHAKSSRYRTSLNIITTCRYSEVAWAESLSPLLVPAAKFGCKVESNCSDLLLRQLVRGAGFLAAGVSYTDKFLFVYIIRGAAH